MVVIRVSRGDNRAVIGWQGTDTWSDNDKGSFFDFIINQTNESLVTWYNVTFHLVTIDRWTIQVNTNTNVSAGALLQGRRNLIDIPTFILVIDQLTGIIKNLTQSLTLDSSPDPTQFISWRYDEGSVGGAANLRTHLARANLLPV